MKRDDESISRGRPARRSLDALALGPTKGAVLAVVYIVLGLLFAAGWFEPPPDRATIPGRDLMMALLCWVMAAVFARAAYLGTKLRDRRRGRR